MVSRRRWKRAAYLLGIAGGAIVAVQAQAQAQVGPPAGTTIAAPKPGKKDARVNDGRLARVTPDRVLKARNALQPNWGNIRTFWGDNTPFWGNIRTFWGDVNPYEGNLSAFWGNIRTFNDGSDPTSLAPNWGNIRTFAGDIGAQWGNIRTFWDAAGPYDAAPQDYDALAGEIRALVDQSAAFWSPTIEAETGASFSAAFADPLLRRFGIDLADPRSLSTIDPLTREKFFMAWNDGLMEYSGANHVDHWMRQVNWNPALTQTLGAGADTTIGLLDFRVTGDETRNLVEVDGISEVAGGHGAAVASLLVGAHDGKGVMGIAPAAKVVAYNPFDETLTAGWGDIRNGIVSLSKGGASIINMSLGVPGWTLNPDWNPVFTDKEVRRVAKNRIFVAAAGNDGIEQNYDIEWDKNNPALIVVGSVDPNGVISSFSNTPGDTCLVQKDKCKADDDRLMNHFIVAPGELILVSDGRGGVTRLSGTSFAAPLVAGTIALIHDRWPWLSTRPKDTVNIVLKSARDLGAPGIDGTYGVGQLDVEAALSPLDWTKLTLRQYVDGKIVATSLDKLRATTAATRATWEPKGVYISAFEDTGESYRDFQIPLSSRLLNQTVSVNGAAEQFMGYLTSRFGSWLGAPTRFAGAVPTVGFSEAGVSRFVSSDPAGGIETTMTLRPRTSRIGFRSGSAPFEGGIRFGAADGSYAFQTGNGDAAEAIGAGSSFIARSDYDVVNGGANPFAGFASGGFYAQGEMAVAPGVTVATGITQRELRRDLTGLAAETRVSLGGIDPYRATAMTSTVRYRASAALVASFTYTQLHEDKAVLGMQSPDPNDLPGGAITNAATIVADLALSPTLSLSGTATTGRTRTRDGSDAAIAIRGGGVRTSAFQIALGKDRLFDSADRLRLTLAQPMYVESGRAEVSTVGVVDRATGEIGTIVQRVSVAGAARRYVAEMAYGRDVMGGAAQVSLFGRASLQGSTPDDAPLVAGGSFRLAF